MSCCCNQSPCVCVPQCPEACPEIEEYSAANINLAGVGVLDAEVDQEFQFRGIRSTNSNITVVLNNTFHTIDLTIDQTTFKSTTTFANAATRANTVPAFEGQFGVQIDTDVPYIANGVAAGNWIQPWLIFGITQAPILAGTTTVQSLLHVWNWDGLTNSSWTFNQFGTFTFSNCPNLDFVTCNVEFSGGTTTVLFNAIASATFSSTPVTFTGSTVTFTAITNFNAAGGRFAISGAAVPANSLLRTTVNAGELTSDLITAFLSSNNTQVGWGNPIGTLTRTAFDTATVTLPQLAERVAALITDLKARLLPAT